MGLTNHSEFRCTRNAVRQSCPCRCHDGSVVRARNEYFHPNSSCADAAVVRDLELDREYLQTRHALQAQLPEPDQVTYDTREHISAVPPRSRRAGVARRLVRPW